MTAFEGMVEINYETVALIGNFLNQYNILSRETSKLTKDVF
jgi:hypothetical protein